MLAAAVRRLRRVTSADGGEQGISLMELIVAMMIFSILLAVTVGFFTSASRANQTDRTIDSTNRQASAGVDEIGRIVRGATTNPLATAGSVPSPAFSVAGANTITLYTNVNLASTTVAQTEQVQFSVDASGNLVEKIWQPITTNGYFTFAANPTTTRILASPVVQPAAGGPNLFSYLDSTGAAIAMTNSAVPAASISSIAAVQVSLQIGASNSASQSTLLTNIVGLPNLQIARNPS
jgi:prepilin-type N-terminal cleavage/methylation domain-containing protein